MDKRQKPKAITIKKHKQIVGELIEKYETELKEIKEVQRSMRQQLDVFYDEKAKQARKKARLKDLAGQIISRTFLVALGLFTMWLLWYWASTLCGLTN